MDAHMELLNLPPEIWASINNYICGEHLARLKLTGSKTLWRKICSAWSVVAVSLGSDFIKFKRWPAFLYELPSVRELAINNNLDTWWQDLEFKLHYMPKMLTKLQIKGPETYLSSFFIQTDGGVLWLDENIPLLEYLSVDLDWSSDYPWMSRMPSTLTFLSFLNHELTMPLPTSLKHLEFEYLDINATRPNIPPHLESIEGSTLWGIDALISRLPPSFHTLKVDIIRSFGLPLIRSKFPNTITALDYFESSAAAADDDDDDDADDDELASLSELRILRARRFPERCWKDLPTTLQSLTLDIERCPSTRITHKTPQTTENETRSLCAFPINTLPRNLTKLELKFDHNSCRGSSLVDTPGNVSNTVSWFPPCLTWLEVDCQMSVYAAKDLPPTLTHLSCCNIDKTVVGHFPRSLKTLVAKNVILSTELIKFLPRSLSSLSLTIATIGCDWFKPSGQLSVLHLIMRDPKSDIKYLNEVGTASASQRIITKVAFDKVEACLPSSLTQIHIDGFAFDDSFVLQQHLSYLRDLRIPTRVEFSNAIAPHLSPQLTTLLLPEARELTGKCFAHLPRNLTKLTLVGEDVVDEDIPHLPSALKILVLLENNALSDECAGRLPRSLEVFYIRKNHIFSTDTLPSLPALLKSPLSAFKHSLVTNSWHLHNGVVATEPCSNMRIGEDGNVEPEP